MKGIGKKITLTLLLFGLFFVFAVHSGYATEAQVPANTPVRDDGNKEILIATDIGGGLPFSHTFFLAKWCGNNSFLIHGTETGIQLMYFKGNTVTVSKNGTDDPIGCTPDGKWVFYKDSKSAREYRDKFGRVPEDIVDEGPGWHGFVMDLYRYEVTTGKRQRFAVVRDDSSALVSPDGSKVFLGNRHDSTIEMPEPKWEAVWFTNDWTYLETFWLPDSSGIVTLVWGYGASLGVEFFGRDGWVKEFSLDKISPAKMFSGSLNALDDKGRLYFTSILHEASWQGRSTYGYFRCEIQKKELICGAIGELDGNEHRIASHKLLPNGNVVFKKEDDCIRLMKAGQNGSKCIADTRYNNEVYIGIDLMEVSPDGKWMAFRRSKLPPPGKRFYAYQYDLFVKELSDD